LLCLRLISRSCTTAIAPTTQNLGLHLATATSLLDLCASDALAVRMLPTVVTSATIVVLMCLYVSLGLIEGDVDTRLFLSALAVIDEFLIRIVVATLSIIL